MHATVRELELESAFGASALAGLTYFPPVSDLTGKPAGVRLAACWERARSPQVAVRLVTPALAASFCGISKGRTCLFRCTALAQDSMCAPWVWYHYLLIVFL